MDTPPVVQLVPGSWQGYHADESTPENLAASGREALREYREAMGRQPSETVQQCGMWWFRPAKREATNGRPVFTGNGDALNSAP